MPTALLSVFNKEGIVLFAQGLVNKTPINSSAYLRRRPRVSWLTTAYKRLVSTLETKSTGQLPSQTEHPTPRGQRNTPPLHYGGGVFL